MGFLAAAAPILGAVGAGVSAIGSIAGGESQAAEARYQAQVAQNNQLIAEQNANYATAAGQQQVYNVGLQQRAKAGEITTGAAASGLDVNTGSPAQLRVSQAELGEQAEETTAQNAALTAYGYRTQATSYGAQAQLLQAEAPMDVAGGFLGATGGLLSAAGNIPFKWWALQNPTNPQGAAAALTAPGSSNVGL